MILQALYEYYHRKMSAPDPAKRLPAFGLENKEIGFVLELSPDGKLVAITDTRAQEGKSKPPTFLVPLGVKKTSGVAANLLWDTAEYALGAPVELKAKAPKSQRLSEQHAAFRSRINALPEAALHDAGVKAVNRFLDNAPMDSVKADRAWEDIRTTNPWVSFRLTNDNVLICQRPAVVAALAALQPDGVSSSSICLITGNAAPVERLHTAIKGIRGAQTSGANIVSFNLDAFNSYGKEQGANAPVGPEAAFAYTTALNHLLGKKSRQRVQVGDASTVFWAQKDDGFEDTFGGFFGDGDDPDARVEQVRALLQAMHSGGFDGGRGRTKFYVLGLAPNAARISIRFWHAEPLFEVARRIVQWFADLEVVRGPADPQYPSLFRLLAAVAVQGKADNVPPNLGGEVMRSILTGTPFPLTWLAAAVQRCRAEQRVTYLRAATIKACLNRSMPKPRSAEYEWEFTPMLDEKNPSPAYRLGRLFAVLEKTQEEANPGINATIRERYYGAASTVPVSVFPSLLRLKNHHIAKIDSRGRVVTLERLIGQIMDDLGSDFPAHLSLPDQGRFALGYYQQRQAFYTRNIASTETAEATTTV